MPGSHPAVGAARRPTHGKRLLNGLDGRRELLLHGGGAAARLLHLPQALGKCSLGCGQLLLVLVDL